jgi:hypothetical protein
MTFNCPPIIIGQIAPSDESHRTRIVEQQDRGTVARQRSDYRFKRCLVYVGTGSGLLQMICQAIQRVFSPRRDTTGGMDLAAFWGPQGMHLLAEG